MPQRRSPPIPYTPLRLMKTDVRQDHDGVSVVMEFVDDHGTKLTTPSMPYPDSFDPMSGDINADRRGDEIRIKNSDGDVLVSVFADSVDYESPIETALDPNGYPCILPEEGEDLLPTRRFSMDRGHPSEVGFAQAFEQANRARQELDATVQEELNRRFPDQARPVVRASELMRQRQQAGFPFPSNEECSSTPTPKIKIDFDMKCMSCEGKIHYPDKIIKLLGEEGTIKYFDFCKKTGSEPQMFCCGCFAIMKNNPNIISAINKMNLKIKDMMDLTEREETVTKRENELDEQLKKEKKK